jgi:hypothetical protein
VMTVYLWHFVPVIVIAVVFFPTGVTPQPAVGTAQWWELRPAWFALLTVVLVPLVVVVMRMERPMLRLPTGLGPSGPWSPVLLVLGLAASMAGLARLAIAGFAPDGRLPVLVLAACATAWPRPCSPAAPRPRAPNREPSAAAAAAQGCLNRIPGIFADRRPVCAVVTAWPDGTLWRLTAGLWALA